MIGTSRRKKKGRGRWLDSRFFFSRSSYEAEGRREILRITPVSWWDEGRFPQANQHIATG